MKEKIKNFIDKHSYSLNFLLVMIGATAAAFCFRASAGIIAMTPLYLIIIAAASFVNIETKIKAIAIGVTIFTFNTLEQSELSTTFIYTFISVVAALLFSVGAAKLKTKKKIAFAYFVCGAIICSALSFVFIGNPIKAIKEKNKMDEYISSTYENIANKSFGEFEFTNIYYNYNDKTYSIMANSNVYPTEIHAISVKDGYVTDDFMKFIEKKVAEPYVQNIYTVLRKNFPTDIFAVSCENIFIPNGTTLLSYAEGDLADNISYEIKLDGIQTANNMNESVKDYKTVLDEEGADYSKIVFNGGNNYWVRRIVTVGNAKLMGFYDENINYIPVSVPPSLNGFLNQINK